MPRNKKLGQPIPADPPEEPPFKLLPFECAEVKTEALDEDYEFAPEPELAFPFKEDEGSRSSATSSVAVQTMRRQIMSRSVQVNMQLISHETLLADVQPWPGLATDGPLKADGGTVERQCRICLRRLPEASLTFIVFSQKTKIFTALGVKIYLGDAYPLICRNCAGLVELIYDFRNTCMRARNMLVQERKSIENNDWDSARNLEIVEQCRALVETHKREIDAAYEQPSVPQFRPREAKEDIVVKPEIPEVVLLDQSSSKESMVEEDKSSPRDEPKDASTNRSRKIDLKKEPDSHLSDQNDFSATDDEDPVYKQPPSDNHDDKDEEDPDCKSSSDDDKADDGDFAPSLSPVPRKRRTRIVTKPYKKRVKKEKPAKKEAGTNGAGEGTEKQKQKGSLCDFCGKWVRQKMVETHANQHLGIKPYPCQTEGCEWAFTSRMLLVRHVKRKHNANYLECDICNQRIRGFQADLTKHKKTHTQKKDYVCPVCGKGFTTPDYLRKHGYVHSEEMPFECSVCYRKFNNKYNMLTHEKKHFQRGEAAPAAPPLPPAPGQGGSADGLASSQPYGSAFSRVNLPPPGMLPAFVAQYEHHE